ncbi:MAG: coproporphyrinogen dehydrogenase HemZ [Clostridia bacterium]|nr:coproporphyrinogen dehydrogenase HemZ [Clostridia bacterium]
MILHTLEHTYKYECEKICRIYFPAEKIVFACDNGVLTADSKEVFTKIEEISDSFVFSCKAVIDGKEDSFSFSCEKEGNETDSQKERLLAKAIVKVLTSLTGIVPPWGILTGVRPAKLMRNYINTEGEERAREIFTSFLEVTPEKTALAAEVAGYENTCIAMSGKNSFSLYVSIPFCPTRCSYCSFVSHSIDKAKKLIPDYIKNLCLEIEETGKLCNELGLVLETVYIGGGTPTSFSADALFAITSALNKNFDMDNIKEFTVEAGRPDTVDEEKLRVLKNAGVTRISINPQTFSDSVLEAIGRRHTAEDTVEKFYLARKTGFDNINMDLIAGLPHDSFEGFRASLDKACELSPENITVHTLALKRAADIVTGNEADSVCRETEKMVCYANKKLTECGYHPYYMYRQSKSVGNLENVGWCKKDKPCLYNIYMMEEIHTVLAVGAAAVTKLKDETSLERVYNFKYPYEYISRFSEIIEKKDAVRKFCLRT